tara:strand:- start:843 stop:1109 length:267 start_codon:yes stop_codon:yes gene_type:complete
MEERNDLIKELFELHKLLADKGEIGIGYGFSKNYNRLKKQVKKLTLTDVSQQRELLKTFCEYVDLESHAHPDDIKLDIENHIKVFNCG